MSYHHEIWAAGTPLGEESSHFIESLQDSRGIIRCDLKPDKRQKVDKNSIIQFSPKYPLLGQMGNLGPIWPKIMQPYILWSALNVFLEHIMGHNIKKSNIS